MKVISLVVWVVLVLRCCVVNGIHDISAFNRSAFPSGFLFGAASAAFQYEGAAFEDGRGPSIWDNFTHQFLGKILNQSTADVADNFYHLYKEDVKLMKFVGLDAFRFSISWSRILPRGKLSGGVNKKGVAFYNNLINELLSKGIKPFVTLHHWDTPQELEDEYGSFRSPRIVDDYSDYVELCFKEFGDRAKHWITFNEPYIFSTYGYDDGSMAPGRCSAWVSNGCPAGDSATEPYIVAHNILLAHAAAVKLYKQKYQATQKGEIGITHVSHWFVPYSSSKLDIRAKQRALDFMFGWFMDPLIFGDDPKIMQKYVKNRLPKFTSEQKQNIKGSFDFIGINYYTAKYAAHDNALSNKTYVASSKDSLTLLTFQRNGHFIGEKTGCNFYYAYPRGFTDLLDYINKKYTTPPIYITENGIGDTNTASLQDGINDVQRVNFYHRHLLALKKAMKMGVNVKGFFAWSFLDDFEWDSGYTLRFGLCYVDFADGLKRYPKNSALWFKKFLHN